MTSKNRCVECLEYKNCRDSSSSWIFFAIGLIATLAVRVVTVLMHLNPIYAKIAWYIGICGFFLFFVYKFKVSLNRAKAIDKNDLMQKINNGRPLSTDDYNIIGSILCGLRSRKEMINYSFIFGTSAIAIALAVYMDFIK